MSSILDNVNRLGAFTSSEIYKLLSLSKDKKDFGKAGLTYIKTKNNERRLGRSISTEISTKAMLWGLAMESICFNKLGLEYTHCSQETAVHPRLNFWAGSADGLKYDEGKTVFDFKSPYTLTSFCDLVQPIYDGLTGMEAMNWIRNNHDAGEQYFWQLISNSILHDTKYCELVVYMPYESEIEEIRQAVEGNPSYYWLYNALQNELPFLPNNGFYKNINTIRFEPSIEDKNLLIETVIKAGKHLI